MARKLYGAAAKAHAKRLSKTRRKRKRRNPAAVVASNPHRRRRRRKARKNPAKRRRRARRNPSRRARRIAAHYHSGARGYAAGSTKAKRRAAGKKAARTRKRNLLAGAAAPKRRRRRARKSTSVTKRRAAARRRYRAKHPGAKRRPGVKALRRARRSIKRAYRRGGRAGAYARRHRMRSNPRRRHARRRHYRRNPGLGGIGGTLMGALKAGAPLAASFYLTKFIINKVGPMIPGLSSLPVQVQGPALAAGMVVLANYGTKRGALSKYRMGIMAGVSLNLVDTLVKTFAPESVKSMFGIGDSGMYDRAMGEFVTVGDYLEVGATPIDDDIALSDYVEMSGVEEELGALQEELGVEEELGNGSPFGDSGPNRLGGVGQSSMLKALKAASAVGIVPQRSFIKQVPHAGPGYDNAAGLYVGNFAGGF